MKRGWVLLLFLGAAVSVDLPAPLAAGTKAATANLTSGQESVLPAPIRFIAHKNGYQNGSGIPEGALYAEALTPGQGRGHEHGGGRGEGRGHEHGGPRGRGRKGRRGRAAFSSREQTLIRRYFRNQRSNLPPGLAKRGGNLPPGLERHLEKYGTLPPGLQKRLQPFPERLARELPPLPYGCGCRRVILGDRALIIDTANRILDMFLYR